MFFSEHKLAVIHLFSLAPFCGWVVPVQEESNEILVAIIILQDFFPLRDGSCIKSFVFARWQHYPRRMFKIYDRFLYVLRRFQLDVQHACAKLSASRDLDMSP